MKSFAKAVIRTAIAAAPDRSKSALLNALADDRSLSAAAVRSFIKNVSPRLGLNGLRFSGVQGDFIFSPNDMIMSVIYSREKTWASEIVDDIVMFYRERDGKGTYLDIGANVGLTTVPIASAFPDVDCHAFEPEQRNVKNLKSNLICNLDTSKNVTVHPVALYTDHGELTFEINETNHGDHRIRTMDRALALDGEEERRTVRIKAIPLDALSLAKTGPLAVKIDVQGGEPFVIAGGSNTLGRAGLLAFEWSPYQMLRMGGDPKVVLNFLIEHFVSAEVSSPTGTVLFTGLTAQTCEFLEAFNRDSTKNPYAHVDVKAKK